MAELPPPAISIISRFAVDDGEQIVEIVRHPAGQLSDRLHFLGLVQFGLDPSVFVRLARADDGEQVGDPLDGFQVLALEPVRRVGQRDLTDRRPFRHHRDRQKIPHPDMAFRNPRRRRMGVGRVGEEALARVQGVPPTRPDRFPSARGGKAIRFSVPSIRHVRPIISVKV